MSHSFAVKEQSISSKVLAGSVPSAEVPLIPNIATEMLSVPDRKRKRE